MASAHATAVASPHPAAPPWTRREDTWAIAIAFALVLAVTGAFFTGARPLLAVAGWTVPGWSGPGKLASDLGRDPVAPLALFGLFLAGFAAAARVMRWQAARFAAGFAALTTAKALLRRAGFRDPEFQIVLEYTRAWGIL